MTLLPSADNNKRNQRKDNQYITHPLATTNARTTSASNVRNRPDDIANRQNNNSIGTYQEGVKTSKGSGIYFEDHEVPLPALANVTTRKRPQQQAGNEVLHGRPMSPPPALFNAFHFPKKRCVSPMGKVGTIHQGGEAGSHNQPPFISTTSVVPPMKISQQQQQRDTTDSVCREAALTLSSFCSSSSKGPSCAETSMNSVTDGSKTKSKQPTRPRSTIKHNKTGTTTPSPRKKPPPH